MIDLTEPQKVVLRVLLESDQDLCYYYSYIQENAELPMDVVKTAIKDLRILGLVEHHKGLFDEDGMTAGSGHQIVYGKTREIVKLLGDSA